FTAMTPPQQALFLRFAQRQRPFLEPWRLQHGSLRVATGPPAPATAPVAEGPARVVARVLFDLQFGGREGHSYPIDLCALQPHWNSSLRSRVGQPFPFPEHFDGPTVWQQALSEPGLRSKPLVILIAWPFSEPYSGNEPPPAAAPWSRRLAE